MKERGDVTRWIGRALALAVVLALVLAVGPSAGLAQQVSVCYPTTAATVTVGTAPHGIGLNTSAKRLYVGNHDSDNLSVINLDTFAVIKTVGAGDGPNGVAYNLKNKLIYIANRNSNKVKVIRASDYAFITNISVGSLPDGVAVNTTTNRVYVANFGSGTVSIIDANTNKVWKTVTVGGEPSNIAVHPGLNKAFVTLHAEGHVAVIDGSGNVTKVNVYAAGPYGIGLDMVRNLVYVATIDTFRITVMDATSNKFLGWAEIRRMPNGEPVPLRQIVVNPYIGTSGHVYVTTTSVDGGWNKVLMLGKGWPEHFDRAVAVDLSEPQEGIAFQSSTNRVFVTSRAGGKLAVYTDGVPPCPYNFADEYQVTVCVANPDGSCAPVATW
jgi:YVTN family beta-propeller protein